MVEDGAEELEDLVHFSVSELPSRGYGVMEEIRRQGKLCDVTLKDNYGSSMVCQVNKTWVQMGVVSWTFSCNQHRFPGVYTSTSYFTHWIRRQITNVTFITRAHLAVLSPVLLTACVLLGSPGSTRLL